MINIEVVYATRENQQLLSVRVPEGISMIEAVRISQVDDYFDELELNDKTALGVFGKKRPQNDIVREGDRIEVYRPLIADPKEVRRMKAEQKKAQEKAAQEK